MRVLHDSFSERIQFLERALHSARTKITELSRAQLDFTGYYRCNNRDEGYEWLNKLKQDALKEAVCTPGVGFDALNLYAFCPLCNRGASDFYAEKRGFKFPIGLTRHFDGWGNQNQCAIIEATEQIARDYWDKSFRAQEQEIAQKADEGKLARQKIENRYLIDPHSSPLFFDEGCTARPKGKSEPGILWAEERLESLGLQRRTESQKIGPGLIVSFSDVQENYAVYGDPRPLGHVSFLVVLMKNGKPVKRKAASLTMNLKFDFQDRWKNDLLTKYREQVSKALGSGS